MAEKEVLLEINHLKAYFPVKRKSMKEEKRVVKAVDDISIEIFRGETLGIVGESGSGKSTFGRTILQLVEPTAGEILYKGHPIQHLKGSKLQKYRNQMQMIFQDPFASLNPRMRIGAIIEEPMALQLTFTKEQRKERVKELLQKVGLPEDAMQKFPHEFSGGQRQRIGIARALAINPAFIIADEPVSALDVSVQSQVLNLMMDLQEEFQLTYLFISHDLSVVKHISDRVAVLYLGRVVEIGTKKELYAQPLHPYTKALLSAIPVVNFDEPKQVMPLQGELPSPMNPPIGCVFHTRCPCVMEKCHQQRPTLQKINEQQRVACFLYDK
ncbi:ABC transporter ATP-binding protein [Lysinibacillus parviboronicapiens]|uniref:ABC transporter ATP-binding protein n=1 Tax=Lysinibacillus parviboronicapiens TaxID=436516 RepID=UPI000D339D06|nr:dipeptide ABC transporter ATP-binding protein [Lysinibacillus parviboronicapiens]